MLSCTFEYQLSILSIVFFYLQTTMWLVIFQLQFYLWLFCCHLIAMHCVVIYVHTVYMHEHFPFSYTLIRSLPDDPRFARLYIGYFILLIRCSLRSYALRGAGVFSLPILVFFLSFYSCFYSCIDFIYQTHCLILFLYFICYHCVKYLYVILQWYWFIVVAFYNLFRLF